MRISILVHPSSREDKVEEQVDESYVVEVNAPTERGKASAAIVKLLSNCSRAEVRIISGFTSRHETMEVA